MNKSFALFFLALLSVSCGTMTISKTSQFAKSPSLATMNGAYSNRSCYVHDGQKWSNYISILDFFGIEDETDDIAFAFEGPDKIRLTYYADSIKKEAVFYGKVKRKFIEITFHKDQFIIPLIYSRFSVDRIRIGVSAEGNGLAVERLWGTGGNFLFIGAGGAPASNYTFARVSQSGSHTPVIEGGKWGYADALSEYVIHPQYEYAARFEQGVARVKSNGKWSLINRDGEKISRCEYDWISPIDTLESPHFIVQVGGKWGVINRNGDQIIPTECDELNPSLRYGYSTFRIGEKYGVASREGVLYPAVFSDVNMSVLWPNGPNDRGIIATVQKDGEKYVIDKDGYAYEFTKSLFANQPINWKNKMKIGNSPE